MANPAGCRAAGALGPGLTLPPAQAADLVVHGWGVLHPWAGTRLSAGCVMLFGPGTVDELETVTGVVAASNAYASSAQA